VRRELASVETVTAPNDGQKAQIGRDPSPIWQRIEFSFFPNVMPLIFEPLSWRPPLSAAHARTSLSDNKPNREKKKKKKKERKERECFAQVARESGGRQLNSAVEKQRHGRSRKRRDISMRRAHYPAMVSPFALSGPVRLCRDCLDRSPLRPQPNVSVARVLAGLAEGVEVDCRNIHQGALQRSWNFRQRSQGCAATSGRPSSQPSRIASTLAGENPHCDLGYSYFRQQASISTGLTNVPLRALRRLFSNHTNDPADFDSRPISLWVTELPSPVMARLKSCDIRAITCAIECRKRRSSKMSAHKSPRYLGDRPSTMFSRDVTLRAARPRRASSFDALSNNCRVVHRQILSKPEDVRRVRWFFQRIPRISHIETEKSTRT